MSAIVLRICRLLVTGARWWVPSSLREAWREEWLGRLWEWMLREAATGDPEARRALLAHSRKVLQAALWARFRSDVALETWRAWRGDPRFPFALGGVALVSIAVFSGGFSISRGLFHGVPYPDSERVALLAQGPPTLGLRLGFLQREADLFARKASTLDSLATYKWYPLQLAPELGGRQVTASAVSQDFFRVLAVTPSLGQALAPSSDGTEPFLVSDQFFRQELRSNQALLGRTFQSGSERLRFAGVLPRGFAFLGAGIPVWVLRKPEPPPPRELWWLGLRGTVARLNPGVTLGQAEIELQQLLVDAHFARSGSRVHATPVSAVVYRALGTYGGFLLASLGGLFLWAAVCAFRDVRSGYPRATAVRFWGFFAAKSVLPLLAVFLFVFEMMGVNRLGMTGGIWWGRELFAMWAAFCGTAITGAWAWRDQRRRCRDCFERMRQPVRIGVPGQMLLDPTGEEVMCPHGHGSLYTSESVLGSELSDHWVDLKLG